MFLIGLAWKVSPVYVILTILCHVLSTVINTLSMVWFIPSVITMINAGESPKAIVLFIISYGAAALIVNLISVWFLEYKSPKENINLYKSLKKSLYEKNLQLDIRYFENNEFYDKYIRANEELNGRIDNVLNTISLFLGNIISAATIISVLFSFSIRTVVLILGFSCVSLVINSALNKTQYKMNMAVTRVQQKLRYIDRIFFQQGYAKELRSTEIGEVFLNSFEGSIRSMIDKQVPFRKKTMLLGGMNGIINNVFYYGLFAIYVFRFSIGAYSIGNVVSIVNSISLLKTHVMRIFSIAPELQNNSMYIENLRDYLNLESGKTCEKRGGKIDNSDNIIELRDVSFKYSDSGKCVTNSISLDIKKKSHIAIVGYNGAGKTTLLNLIMKLYKPDEGKIYYNGIDIQGIDDSEYKAEFSVLFQDFNIYALTIAENILLKRCETSIEEERVRKALKEVGLWERVEETPNGIYSYISKEYGEDGVFFSGGEKQKLALARVIANKGEVIILDEPTAALDPMAENRFFNMIEKVFRDNTVILVSHKLLSVKNADRIIFMDGGAIKEAGTHEELMNMGGSYAEMYTAQFNNYKRDKGDMPIG